MPSPSAERISADYQLLYIRLVESGLSCEQLFGELDVRQVLPGVAVVGYQPVEARLGWVLASRPGVLQIGLGYPGGEFVNKGIGGIELGQEVRLIFGNLKLGQA